jgi:hypothetical protein
VAIVLLPTNVSLPTRMDNAREDYLADRLTVWEFEERVGAMLADGTADKVDSPFKRPYHGHHLHAGTKKAPRSSAQLGAFLTSATPVAAGHPEAYHKGGRSSEAWVPPPA